MCFFQVNKTVHVLFPDEHKAHLCLLMCAHSADQRHCQEAAAISLQLPELAWQARQDRLHRPADDSIMGQSQLPHSQSPEASHQETSLLRASQPSGMDRPVQLQGESTPATTLTSAPGSAGTADQDKAGEILTQLMNLPPASCVVDTVYILSAGTFSRP